MTMLEPPTHANACPSHADDVFGPVVAQPCRQHFDFTLMFEQSILSIGPSSIMLLLLPMGLYWLRGADVKVRSGFQFHKGKTVGHLVMK